MTWLFIVDAGVLFSTWIQRQQDATFLTPTSLLDEVRNRPSKQRIDMMRSIDRFYDEMPSQQAMTAVRAAAKGTGDLSELSENDIDLIALALDKKGAEPKSVLVSTDFAILNTAISLGIDIIDPSKRFRTHIRWVLKCPACGEVSSDTGKERECPVCGTEMKRTRAAKR